MPSILIIIQQKNTLKFSIEWNSSTGYRDNLHYNISISYVALSSTPSVVILKEPSDSFTLLNNTEYIICISTCDNNSQTANFSFGIMMQYIIIIITTLIFILLFVFFLGRCPLLKSLQNITLESYVTDTTGVMGALFRDVTSNESITMYCSNSGEWDWSAISHFKLNSTMKVTG